MTSITATADAKVFRNGPFWTRRRYRLELHVNGVHTGLQWLNLSRKQAKTMPKIVVENAAELLEHYKLMEQTYTVVSAQQKPDQAPAAAEKELVTPDGAVITAPFRAGVKIQLTTAIGKDLPKGHVGTITRIDELIPGYAVENQYPIRAAFKVGADNIELPLHFHEIEVAQ